MSGPGQPQGALPQDWRDTAVALDTHKKVLQLIDKVNLLLRQGEAIMALADDLKAGIAKLDAETTQIATVISALVAKLQAGGLSPQDQADIFAALGAVSDRLTSLGVDPTAPVPAPTPAINNAKKLAGV
jgi:hypothetical protein